MYSLNKYTLLIWILLAESSNESHSDCICSGRDILEKEESTQALSAFYGYFSDAPAEG